MTRTAVLCLVFLALGIAAGLLFPRSSSERTTPPDPRLEGDLLKPLEDESRIVARVGTFAVTEKELLHRWRSVLDANTRDFYRRKGGIRDYLDQIIEEKMLAQEAMARGYLSEEKTRIDLAMTRDVLVAKPLLSEEVRSKSFPEEKLRAYYDENSDRFQRRESVSARHIVVSPTPFPAGQPLRNETGDDATDEEEANRKIEFLQDEIASGADFAQLARLYSEDLTAPIGGDLGVFERGQMLPEFEEIVFGLEVGEVSDPITTRYGYHIVKLEGRTEPGPIPYEEARSEIVEQFLQEDPNAAKTRYKTWLGELQKGYPVHLLVSDEELLSLDGR